MEQNYYKNRGRNEKQKMKKVKIITIILAIILITLVAFGGVYLQTQNRMENKVKDYLLGREIKGGRVVELSVVQEEDANKTIENYETVKKTLENRLNSLNAEDYIIRLNREDGTIRIEMSEDENTDTYAYYLTTSGKVEMKEKDTETELLNDEMVKKAKYGYTVSAEGEYQIYIELQLTKEGQAKIQEISNDYAILSNEIDEIEAAQEEENSEDSAAEETEEATSSENPETEESATEETEVTEEPQKKIAVLTIGGTEYDISKIDKNILTVNIGGSTSSESSINNNTGKAAEIQMLINAGKMPIDYEVTANNYVYSDITPTQLVYFMLGIAIVLIIVFVIFTVKYKVSGLLSSIACVGFISLLILILRYTNVLITIEGIGAILLITAIYLVFNQNILNKIKLLNLIDEAINNTYKEIYPKLIPFILIALIFCFSGMANLSSFGMVVFWGMILMAVYNITITKALLKLKENK